jgi:hypothetical protein
LGQLISKLKNTTSTIKNITTIQTAIKIIENNALDISKFLYQLPQLLSQLPPAELWEALNILPISLKKLFILISVIILNYYLKNF